MCSFNSTNILKLSGLSHENCKEKGIFSLYIPHYNKQKNILIETNEKFKIPLQYKTQFVSSKLLQSMPIEPQFLFAINRYKCELFKFLLNNFDNDEVIKIIILASKKSGYASLTSPGQDASSWSNFIRLLSLPPSFVDLLELISLIEYKVIVQNKNISEMVILNKDKPNEIILQYDYGVISYTGHSISFITSC